MPDPPFPDMSLTLQAAQHIFRSIATSTRRTYPSGERQFIRFCLSHKLISPQKPLLPAYESTLIHFVTHLSTTVSHATIKVYLAAVKNLHTEFGCPLDFGSMPLLYKTLRGIKSSLGISKRARYPITVSVLHKIYAKLKPFHSSDLDSSMLWAAFTLAFFGFLRSSEFTCICGLDSTQFASHSFRIGAATTAAAAGVPDWLIKVLGRWKSDAYQSYIRTPRETLLQVPQNLASCLIQH